LLAIVAIRDFLRSGFVAAKKNRSAKTEFGFACGRVAKY
jgi:hypothetical protein